MANMKQIAEAAGVSLGTVSHVLNGSARVRDPLRKRVLAAVEALDYRPSELARGLRRDKTNMIGMIIPDITNPFFPGVVRGAEDVAFANGYRLILCNTDNDRAKELAHLHELRTFLPAGLIVIPSNLSDLTAQTEPYRKAGVGVVCIDRLPKRWNGDSVTTSNQEGAFEATRYLINLGHTVLAAISGPLHLTNSKERLQGFQQALRKAGLRIPSEYMQETTFDKQGGYSKTKILLRLIPRPTAIFASNDMIALGVLLAIREEGLHCPQDISLMGFDDLDLAETTDPSLSSVAQSGYQLGSTAANLLLTRINGDSSPSKHIVLETSLKIRHSVAPPPATDRKRPALKSRGKSILVVP